MDLLYLIPLIILAIIALSLILGSFFTVNTAQVAVITRFGKFLRVAEAGLNWKTPYIDSVMGLVSLRVNQITLTMETKTKDNVFRRSMTPSTSSPIPWRRSRATWSR
jgi:regulator of protease activity HflC (stomatin/prohibitin superfamily)